MIFLESLRLLRSAQGQPREPVVTEAITEILLISLTAAKTVNRQNTPVKGPSNRGSCYHTRAPVEGLMHKHMSAWDHVYITVTLFPSLFIEEIKSFSSRVQFSSPPPPTPCSCYISPPLFFHFLYFLKLNCWSPTLIKHSLDLGTGAWVIRGQPRIGKTFGQSQQSSNSSRDPAKTVTKYTLFR